MKKIISLFMSAVIVFCAASAQTYAASQENLSDTGSSLLHGAPTLTYYSQMDKSWAKRLYTSTKNKRQTMASSGCGPTSAAMLVSSTKGIILPPEMAKLFVQQGFRTPNDGTSWDAWQFVATYFDFTEYLATDSYDEMKSYLMQDNDGDGCADYYVVASCTYGIFTKSSHLVLLTGLNKKHITVFDPLLLEGKMETKLAVKAKVKLENNVVTVGEKAFKRYGGSRQYWIYSNDASLSMNNYYVAKDEAAENEEVSGETTERTAPAVETVKLNRPQIVYAKNKKRTIKLSWKKVENAVSYEVQYSSSKHFTNPTVIRTRKKKLELNKNANSKYYIRIRAMNGASKSKWSRTIRIKK